MVFRWTSSVASANICLPKSIVLTLVIGMIWISGVERVNAAANCRDQCGPIGSIVPREMKDFQKAIGSCRVFDCYQTCDSTLLRSQELYDPVSKLCNELRGNENSLNCPSTTAPKEVMDCLPTCTLPGSFQESTLEYVETIPDNEAALKSAKAVCGLHLCHKRCALEPVARHCNAALLRISNAMYNLEISLSKVKLQKKNRWPEECEQVLEYSSSSWVKHNKLVSFGFSLIGIVIAKLFF